MNPAAGAPGRRLDELQALLHQEVPLSRHMGVALDRCDDTGLTLSADLEPNINIHGTAFGGSMYSLAALSGWSLLHLRLQDRSLTAPIVLGSAHIDYFKPVRTRLVARASCGGDRFESFTARVAGGQRASIEVEVSLGGLDGGEWSTAAVFKGLYATA